MTEAQSTKKANGHIFYGWWIVFACFLVLVVHAGAAFYSFTIFQALFPGEFNTSTTLISLAASVYLLTLALASPLVGRLTDRYGPKRLLLLGGVIGGVSFMLLSLAGAVWHLYLFYFMIGLGMSCAGVVPISALVSNWFDRRRGLAMGITMAGIAVGALTVPNLTRLLIDTVSWQFSFLMLGLITWVLVIPGVWLLIKNRPQDIGLLPYGKGTLAAEMASDPQATAMPPSTEGQTWTMATALRRPAYWMLMLSFFLVGLGIVGVLQHEVNFLENELLLPSAIATLAVSLTGGMGGLGKLGFGFLADRIAPRHAAILCFALQLVGVVLLLPIIFTQNVAMVWVFVVVYGFAMGGQIALQPLVTAEFFGMASFGAIFGGVVLAAGLGAALGPFIAARLFDISGSYFMAFVAAAVIYALAVVALSFTRRPKPRDATP